MLDTQTPAAHIAAFTPALAAELEQLRTQGRYRLSPAQLLTRSARWSALSLMEQRASTSRTPLPPISSEAWIAQMRADAVAREQRPQRSTHAPIGLRRWPSEPVR